MCLINRTKKLYFEEDFAEFLAKYIQYCNYANFVPKSL